MEYREKMDVKLEDVLVDPFNLENYPVSQGVADSHYGESPLQFEELFYNATSLQPQVTRFGSEGGESDSFYYNNSPKDSFSLTELTPVKNLQSGSVESRGMNDVPYSTAEMWRDAIEILDMDMASERLSQKDNWDMEIPEGFCDFGPLQDLSLDNAGVNGVSACNRNDYPHQDEREVGRYTKPQNCYSFDDQRLIDKTVYQFSNSLENHSPIAYRELSSENSFSTSPSDSILQYPFTDLSQDSQCPASYTDLSFDRSYPKSPEESLRRDLSPSFGEYSPNMSPVYTPSEDSYAPPSANEEYTNERNGKAPLNTSDFAEEDWVKEIKIGKNKRPRGPKCWEFVLRLLQDKRANPSLVKWENPAIGSFRLVEKDKISAIWGNRPTKKKREKTIKYESFARILRYHYKSGDGMVLPVSEKHLVYKFSDSVMREFRAGNVL